MSFASDVMIDNLNISHNRLGSVDLNELLHGSMLKSVEQVKIHLRTFKKANQFIFLLYSTECIRNN